MRRWHLSLLGFGVGILMSIAGCAGSDRVLSQPDLVDQAPTDLALVEQDPPTPTPMPIPTATPQAPIPGAVLRMAIVGEPVLDPTAASPVSPTDMVVVDALYDGLTVWDLETQTWAPDLARDWEQSEDGLSWTATVSGATFSDGVPITAGDVKRSLDRFGEGPLTLAGSRLEIVAEIVTVDFATVRFDMTEPYALLPHLLSSPVFGIVPTGELDGSVGSGPLVMVAPGTFRPRNEIGLAFGGIDLVAVQNDQEGADLRTAGAVDLAYVSPSFDGPTDVSALSTVEVHFALNAVSPRLDDPDRRRSLAEAVSSTAVVEQTFGAGALAIDRLSPAGLSCVEGCADAADLPTPEVDALSIVYVSDANGLEQALAEAVVAQLVAAGFEATATGYGLSEFVELVGDGEYDLVRTGWIGLFPSADSQLAPYLTDSPDNVSAYSNEAFDGLFRAAREAGDRAAYEAAANLLSGDTALIPLARLRVRALVSEAVEGLQLRHDATFDLTKLTVFEAAESPV